MKLTSTSPLNGSGAKVRRLLNEVSAEPPGMGHEAPISDGVSPGRARPVTQTERNRILFLGSDMFWPGGIATYIDSLAHGLMSLGDSVKLLAVIGFDEDRPTDFLTRYEPWAIPFQMVRDEKPGNWLGRKFVSLLDILQCLRPTWRQILKRTTLFSASADAIARFERFVSIEKPTAIVFGNFDKRLYPLALSLLEKRLPYGIIAHGCEIARPSNNKMNDLAQRKTLLLGASWIAANSRHTQSLLEEWRIPPERITILHPPISEQAIRESAALVPVSRKDEAFSLVTICRLVKGKGVDLVLRALQILAARGISCRYAVGGDGPERRLLETLVDELDLRDRVRFMGSVEGEEKWRLLRNADVYVMPSRFEPGINPWQESFGIAFIEAAAFGVPSVGTRGGGIPDAVVDGDTGILVPEESVEDLADALVLLYRRPEIRKAMGRAAMKRARTHFSPEAIAVRFRTEIANLVSKGLQS